MRNPRIYTESCKLSLSEPVQGGLAVPGPNDPPRERGMGHFGCDGNYRMPDDDVIWYGASDVPPNTDLHLSFKRPRDSGAVDVARGQAELLSRYAAELDKVMETHECRRKCTTCVELRSRATLARDMSLIYFRAAELENLS